MLSAVATALALALVGACGLRQDDAPRPLAADAVPTELGQPIPSSTTPLVPTTPQQIFVLENKGSGKEELSGVYFNLPIPTNSDDFPRAVIELLVNLRASENTSFTTAIPPTTSVLDVQRVPGPDGGDDVLEINLNKLEAQGPNLKLAIAQLVFTAAAIDNIGGVRFLLNGAPVAVPLDVGESALGAIVTPSDFPQTNPYRVIEPASTSSVVPEQPDATEAETGP